MPKFHFPRAFDFNCFAIKNLKIYKGFDSDNRSVCNFTPSVIIHRQIPRTPVNQHPLRASHFAFRLRQPFSYDIVHRAVLRKARLQRMLVDRRSLKFVKIFRPRKIKIANTKTMKIFN